MTDPGMARLVSRVCFGDLPRFDDEDDLDDLDNDPAEVRDGEYWLQRGED